MSPVRPEHTIAAVLSTRSRLPPTTSHAGLGVLKKSYTQVTGHVVSLRLLMSLQP